MSLDYIVAVWFCNNGYGFVNRFILSVLLFTSVGTELSSVSKKQMMFKKKKKSLYGVLQHEFVSELSG